jgi:hypothetical protein
MANDVLAQLAVLPGVADAAEEARAAVDALLWDRHTRTVGAELARRSALRGAWANAAMDGAEVPYESIAAGQVEVSPMGDRISRVLALTTQAPSLVDIYARSPLQAWARMNTVLVAGTAPEQEVGRPRADSEAEDPLRLGGVPLAMHASQRLTALADVIVTDTAAPAIVVAGVVHGELAVLRPFRHASGPVARATVRLSLAARGVDPDLLTVPEAGLLAKGRAKYVRALRDYAAGSPEGMAAWLIWFAGAVHAGAAQSQRLAAELR